MEEANFGLRLRIHHTVAFLEKYRIIDVGTALRALNISLKTVK